VHSLCQSFGRIVWLNWDMSLNEDRPAVEFCGYKMYAGPMVFCPVGERALMGIEARIKRKQGRVYVQHSPQVSFDKILPQDTHKTGQDNKIGAETIDQIYHRCIKIHPPSEIMMIEAMSWNTGFARPG